MFLSAQPLSSPSMAIPNGLNNLTFRFFNDQRFEAPPAPTECWDGGVLEFQGRLDRSLPGFFWFQRVKRVKRGAVALAVHPESSNITMEPRPIFAFQYLGRGRTFMSLTDDTWRLRKLVGNRWFYRFWGQVVRWMAYQRNMAEGELMRFYHSTSFTTFTDPPN